MLEAQAGIARWRVAAIGVAQVDEEVDLPASVGEELGVRYLVEGSVRRFGDRVRIKMTALYSEARKLQKAGRGKEMIITYSPDVYRVILAVKPLSAAKFEYYLVRERDNAHPNRSFFLSDLVHAGEGDLPAHITTERAMALNGTKFIADYDNIAE